VITTLKKWLGVNRLLDHTRIDRKTRDKYDERIADSSSRTREESNVS
jgi:hypothetical protein